MIATGATQLVGAYSVPTATLAGIIALLPGIHPDGGTGGAFDSTPGFWHCGA